MSIFNLIKSLGSFLHMRLLQRPLLHVDLMDEIPGSLYHTVSQVDRLKMTPTKRELRQKGEVESVRTLPSSSSPFTLRFYVWSMTVSQPESTASQTEQLLRELQMLNRLSKSVKWGQAFHIRRNKPATLAIQTFWIILQWHLRHMVFCKIEINYSKELFAMWRCSNIIDVLSHECTSAVIDPFCVVLQADMLFVVVAFLAARASWACVSLLCKI